MAEAAGAYRRTLQIDLGHAQARAKLRELAPAQAPASTGHGSRWAPANDDPAAPLAPWQRGQTGPAAVTPAGPSGTMLCPRCRQSSRPGLSCEWCSAPLCSQPAPPAAPWLQPEYAVRTGTELAAGASRMTVSVTSPGEAFGRRFAALLLDQLIVYILGFLAGSLAGFVLGFAAGVQGGQALEGVQAVGRLLGGIAGFTAAVLYYGGMLSACGQTLGKMALGLRVAGPNGGNPSFWRAALRDGIGKPISGICLCLGYFWMLWDSEQQTWHDKIAGTYVVRV